MKITIVAIDKLSDEARDLVLIYRESDKDLAKEAIEDLNQAFPRFKHELKLLQEVGRPTSYSKDD